MKVDEAGGGDPLTVMVESHAKSWRVHGRLSSFLCDVLLCGCGPLSPAGRFLSMPTLVERR